MSSAEVIKVDFGGSETPRENDIEEQLALDLLSEPSRSFVAEQAEKYAVTPREIIDAALFSYKSMCSLVENGGALFVLAKNGRMYPISSDDTEIPPPA